MKHPHLLALIELFGTHPDDSRLAAVTVRAPDAERTLWQATGSTAYPSREASVEAEGCDGAIAALLRALSLGRGQKGRLPSPWPELVEWLELGEGRALRLSAGPDEIDPDEVVYHLALTGPDVDLEAWDANLARAIHGCTVQSGWGRRKRAADDASAS